MTHLSAFALSENLAGKADPALIEQDEHQFRDIAAALESQIGALTERMAALRRAPGGHGQQALDRDQEIHRLTARLRALRRFGLDLCLGRMVRVDDPRPIYVGRFGLTDPAGRRLLIDWRSPAAEPFFGATLAQPLGLASRRRYRWTSGRVSDYWDETFTSDPDLRSAALDDESAFIASLGANRSPRMRDVLATIQGDQDAIIRAGSRGALVVDGGPGTGKTVVALHRAAYLLYSDPQLGHRRGGVLFVGPHRPFLEYVADVLPSLGEEGVQTCTLRDLVAQGVTAGVESDPQVARLKSSARMVEAIEPAVAMYEEPPTQSLIVQTPWAQVVVDRRDWTAAFGSVDPGTPHNEARAQVWDALLDVLVDRIGEVEDDEEVEAGAEEVRETLRRNRELVTALTRAWPTLEAADLVGDLWSVPAYLRRCAPWLTAAEVSMLQRGVPDAWTETDLPLLDAATRRLGDPEANRRRRVEQAAVAQEEDYRAHVIGNLIEADDSEMAVMSMLRVHDVRGALIEGPVRRQRSDVDLLAGPFAHVIVDEAQELTDAQWQMILARCPSGSLTIVGDRAQARLGFPESWQERLGRVGVERITQASLTINYRTPAEVMAEAEPVIREVLPDANVPTSVRQGGLPVGHGRLADRDSILTAWLAAHPQGTAAVIGDPTFTASGRVRSVTPLLAKGLEFDLVVLVNPLAFGDGIKGAVDRYVAMTRATAQLVILTD